MRKVLVADDERALRLLVRTTLEGPELEILEARDGLEAVAVANQEMPDVVLLDIQMPGQDGYEVCKQLKSNPATKGIDVIMLTSNSQPAEVEQGLQAGANHYLTKPFSPLELLRLVDERLPNARR